MTALGCHLPAWARELGAWEIYLFLFFLRESLGDLGSPELAGEPLAPGRDGERPVGLWLAMYIARIW